MRTSVAVLGALVVLAWALGMIGALTGIRPLRGIGGILLVVAGIGVLTNFGRLADALAAVFAWFQRRSLVPGPTPWRGYTRLVMGVTLLAIGLAWSVIGFTG